MSNFDKLSKEFKKYNPLIFDLKNLKSSKILDSNNDIKFSNNVSYPQLSLGFQHYIHKIKDKMQLTEKYANRKKIYLVTSQFEKTIDYKSETESGIKYESIGEGVELFNKEVNPKLPPILNRAYLKLWEMLVYFDLIPDNENFVSAHLCEGPGSFIQATVYWREMQEKLGKIKTSSKDNYYGVTLHSDSEHLQMQKDFINYFDKDKTKRLHVLETKSVDKIKDMYGGGYKGMLTNGDLTKINTIRLFGGGKDVESFAQPSDLVTADGGFDWKKENLQEQEAYKLIYCEIVTALKVQKNGGNFVLKIFESYTHTTLKFIELLRSFYNEVYICKPYTSRISNSEKYIVCKDFIKSKATQSVIKKLEELVITFNKNELFNIIDIFTEYTIPKESLDTYKSINIELMLRQYLGINSIIMFDNLDNKNGIEYNEFLDKQIEASVYWNEMFLETKNYSKISKYFNNFNFLEHKDKLNPFTEYVDNFSTEKQFIPGTKSVESDSETQPVTESESESKPEIETKTKTKTSTKMSRQVTKKTSKKSSKKSSKSKTKSKTKSKAQSGGKVLDSESSDNSESIVNYYSNDKNNSDSDLEGGNYGRLDDDYEDIIDLNNLK